MAPNDWNSSNYIEFEHHVQRELQSSSWHFDDSSRKLTFALFIFLRFSSDAFFQKSNDQ